MTSNLISEFEKGTLPKELWTHEAHVFTAWTYLTQSPFNEALKRIRSAILHFNSKHNGRYRETVTVAFLTVIFDRMHTKLLWQDWAAFKEANPDLVSKNPILQKFYSKDLLMSEAAADSFVEPDLQPLPVVSGVRFALPHDADAIAQIYNYYILHSPATFETEVLDNESMRTRIEKGLVKYPWFVFEQKNEVLGYAYANVFNERAAYQWSVSCSVYVRHGEQGKKIGRTLYEKLLPRLREQGFVNAFGGITLPNSASIKLHEAMGFKKAAHYKNVGFKLGNWHDVGWWQRELEHVTDTSQPIKTPTEILLQQNK